MSTTLFDRLKEAAGQEWLNYTDHVFIQQMEDGTLPPEVFKEYLIQDYRFLVQFARAYALQAYKSRTMADIQIASKGLADVIHETDLHVKRLETGWGVSRQQIESTPEAWTNVAYTRFVLDAGSSGDLLDLVVAQAPCAIGYAEIGERLKPALEANPEHPYAEWIGEYSADWYQQVKVETISHIDALAARTFTEERFSELAEIFTTATRMEAQFWQTAFDLAAANA
ncbi:thiaminase II [Nesterenkonia massiliensis]|uniref:Aminopyrimidine aminohydrolase n=1 Tax=Nesterenkonia massiliensis TaxID=1232429 RepID=A0ABT2HRX6_9MICC|nr:thiaminase II [Nesterenkonia massiliensis]MCT1607440.1 thiaminase II [Nesterenkonia massiliensis]